MAGQGDGKWQGPGSRAGRTLVAPRKVAVSELADRAEVVEPGPKAAAGSE